MKSISLIFAVAAFFSLLGLELQAAENYSLWPRRPEALAQARSLLQSGSGGEAVLLMRPYVLDQGIAGREARQICAQVNTPRYLSRMHPGAQSYTVQKGDNFMRVVELTHCPVDVLMLYNGIVEPSALMVGQKLMHVPMDLRVEIHPDAREITVWDDQEIVADYTIERVEGGAQSRKPEWTTISSREGYLGGRPVSSRSFLFSSADRALKLANGLLLAGESIYAAGPVIRLRQRDVNELSLLLRAGNAVSIHRKGMPAPEKTEAEPLPQE